MQYIYLTLGWFLGLLLVVPGIVIAVTPPYISFSGILLMIAGLVIFPPFRRYLIVKTGVSLTAKMTTISVALLFIGASVLGGMESDRQSAIEAQEQKLALEKQREERREAVSKEFANNRSNIIAEIEELIDGADYRSAITLAEKYLSTGDHELRDLHQTAKVEFQAVQNAKRTQIILEKLNGIPAENYEKNLKLYRELVSMNPADEKYQSKVNFYTSQLETQRRREKVAAERKEKIRTQFSAWDGSHRNLERLIKRTMHNPDSYEHVETTYGDRGDHLIVRTVFRGTNAFGGVVRNAVKAKVSLDGQIISIIE